MAQLIVRNLDSDVKERLKRRAQKHGRSMEEEARHILREAVRPESANRGGLGTRIARRFARWGLAEGEEIPELRGHPVRPAKFR
jgi:plasmid stability protein